MTAGSGEDFAKTTAFYSDFGQAGFAKACHRRCLRKTAGPSRALQRRFAKVNSASCCCERMSTSVVRLSLFFHDVTLARDISIEFSLADMPQASRHHRGDFDIVRSCDNSIPRLHTDTDLEIALPCIHITCCISRRLAVDNGRCPSHSRRGLLKSMRTASICTAFFEMHG
jgi:hypothetical protein